MGKTAHNITATDVKAIYQKVEKSKEGSFFIDSSKKDHKKEIIPNHLEKEVALFFSSENKDLQKKTEALKEDAKIAKMLFEEALK